MVKNGRALMLALDRGWFDRYTDGGRRRLGGFSWCRYVVPHGPGPTCLDLCSTLRGRSPSVAIVVSTPRHTVKQIPLAFDAGADDCLIKPFDVQEVVVRSAGVMHRQRPAAASARPEASISPAADLRGDASVSPARTEHRLAFEEFLVDLVTMRVMVGHREVDLPKRELMLLVYLMHHAGRWVSERELRDRILRTASAEGSSVLRNHVRGLRARLGTAGDIIKSRRGAGYTIGGSAKLPVGSAALLRQRR